MRERGAWSTAMLVIAVIIAFVAIVWIERSEEECERRGGVLVRGAFSLTCVRRAP